MDRPNGSAKSGAPGRVGSRWTRLRARLADRLEGLYALRWVWALLFLVLLAPLMRGPGSAPPLPVPAVGEAVPDDLIAPVTVEFTDDAATRDLRDAARGAVLPIFDLDGRALLDVSAAVEQLFEAGRALPIRGPHGTADPAGARAMREASGIEPAQETLSWLMENRFPPAAEERLLAASRQIYRQRIVGSRVRAPLDAGAILRDTRSGRERKVERLEGVMTLDQARQRVEPLLTEAGAGAAETRALAPLLREVMGPDLSYNAALTEARRQEAAGRVEPLLVRIRRGKVLLRAGELATEEAVRAVQAFNRALEAASPRTTLLANVLFMGLLLFFMSRYVFHYQQSYRNQPHLFALMVVVMVLALQLDALFQWLSVRLAGTIDVGGAAGAAFRGALLPVAAGAMLVTLLANARVGMAWALFYVPLFGMMTGWDLPLVLFGLVSSLAAIYGITAYRERSALIKAGIVLGGLNAVAVLAILSAGGRTASAGSLLVSMSYGFLGGIFAAILVSFLLPLLESMFNIVTDVRLLELSNLNSPLLRRLAVEAPGSYNHSVIVGTLAEAAAEAIGANALFCRVAAYYHDIGKMLKPDYFIENQREQANRHDTLSPQLSALVIASHVKEGYELARAYGIPRPVADIIPQHHGTRKINFFYQKAKRDEKSDLDEVRESDFRYPGPKPQTKEAAIFMLADSVEAAARTLDDPSPSRFKGMIRRIVSDVVLDDQFTECDLTFADLETIGAAFLRTLASIYHHRIDYPGFEFEKIAERPFHGSRTHEAPSPRMKGWGR